VKIDTTWIETGPTALVFDALEAQGHEVFVVGGAVRDAVLGRELGDIDLTTDALPAQMIVACKAAGLKALPTGIEHGTLTILAKGNAHEVTTFRTDVETDGRHAVVAFGGDIQSDAARRDFTMNALYATRSGVVLDPVGGLSDLMAGRLRFVGVPAARIEEDALRILRFFRFHAWYGAADDGLDAEALAAIAAGQDGLENVSAERVHQELRKLLAAPDPSPAVAAMAATGVLARVLPGGDASALGLLVHLEAGRDPRWLRRLFVLGGTREGLRISRKDQRVLQDIETATGLTTGEAAWRFSRDVAEDAALVLAASTETALPEDLEQELDHGAAAVFPLGGEDLLKHMSAGRSVGRALRKAQEHWIASGFKASKAVLLKELGLE